MKEYIEREAALSAVDCGNLHKGIVDALQENIKEIPAADVVEVRKGRWIRTDGIAHGIVSRVYSCSLCKRNAGVSENGFWYLSDFCPNCGADMREV